MSREAVILAGGLGTRLRGVVSDRPKPMALVGGRPFLEILLDRLCEQIFSRVVLAVGYKADCIKGYFGSSYRGIDIEYHVEDSSLGTGGAIQAALSVCCSDPVFVLNGDTYLEFNAGEAEACFHRLGTPLVSVTEVDDISRYGGVIFNEHGIHSFAEKGGASAGYINAGCYVLPRSIFQNYTQVPPFSFERDILPKLITEMPVHAYVVKGRFIDIGVPEDYSNVQQWFN